MTAGRKKAPVAVSARRAATMRTALTVPGARPAGTAIPEARPPAPKWVVCEDCGSARPAHARGRHGAMPVTGGTLAAIGPAWQVCRHGLPFWQGCTGQAVEPPCCAYRGGR
jgi:hypothetical protein